MTQRMAPPGFKQMVRLAGAGANYGLRAGQTFANTNVRYEVVCVSGMQKITARIKTATGGGTIDLFFIGPDLDFDTARLNDTAYGSLAGTIYTTGNATQATVVAGTEQTIAVACTGEDYCLVKFTAAATGTITYCDVARLSVGLS